MVDSGAYSKSPRTLATNAEAGRYLAGLFQKPAPGGIRPITDADLNFLGMALLNVIRRLAQSGLRSGATGASVAKIVGTGASNDFRVYTDGTTNDEAAVYWVGGYPAIFPLSNDNTVTFSTTTSADAALLHRPFSSITTGTLTDTAALWPTNALAGRTLTVYNNNGTSVQTSTIASNTGSVITVSGTFTLGTGATQINEAVTGTGNRYYIAPVTPGANRTDTVWLDVYIDEVGTTKVAGDLVVDTGLTNNITGTGIETIRGARLVQCLFVEEGFSVVGDKFVASGFSLVDGDDNEGLYSWTDTAGNKHYCVRLATLGRLNAVAAIDADMVADKRVIAGRGQLKSLKSLWDSILDNAVLSANGLAASGAGGATLSIAAGTVVHDGEHLVLGAKTFTGPSDGVGGWVDTTAYKCYIPALQREPVVIATGSFPAGSTKICSFSGSGTNVGTLTDDRLFADDITSKFSFDSASKILADLKLGTKGTTRSLIFYDSAGVESARIQPSAATLTISAAAAGGIIVQTATAKPGVVVGNDTNKSVYILGSNTDGIVEAYTETLGQTPKTWKMKETKHQLVQTPAITWGDTALAADAIDNGAMGSDFFVPAIEGFVCGNVGGLGSVVAGSCWTSGAHQYFEWDYFRVNLLQLDGGTSPVTDASKPAFLLPLRIPRGTKVASVKYHFNHNMNVSPAAATIRIDLYYRDLMSSATPTILPDAVTYVHSHSGTTNTKAYDTTVANAAYTHTITITTPIISDRKRLYAAVFMTAATKATSGTNTLDFMGCEVGITARGLGHKDTGATTHISYPWEGM